MSAARDLLFDLARLIRSMRIAEPEPDVSVQGVFIALMLTEGGNCCQPDSLAHGHRQPAGCSQQLGHTAFVVQSGSASSDHQQPERRSRLLGAVFLVER